MASPDYDCRSGWLLWTGVRLVESGPPSLAKRFRQDSPLQLLEFRNYQIFIVL